MTGGGLTELLTTLIWLPAARGESSASAAKLVNVNAVTTAPRRRTLVFILFFSFWFGVASLRRRLVAIGLPRATENPAKKFARNLRDFALGGVVIETTDKTTAVKTNQPTNQIKRKADK